MTAPTDHMTIAEIIHDFATRQGDLTDRGAREDLAAILERRMVVTLGRDEFAAERREAIVEALSWHEDSEGRWGYEKAEEVLSAHESEWCGIDLTGGAA